MTRILFLLIALAAPGLSACAAILFPPYSAEPIVATVIDAETKQPVEGVVVVANWEMRGLATAGGSASIGPLMVLETVTDKDGRLHFPGWGPMIPRGALLNEDPQLLFFKPGYIPQILSNQFRDGMDLEPIRRSDWNGKTIEMKKFTGTEKEYERHLSFLSGTLRFIEDDCQWKKTPRMILALQRQVEQFKKAGIVTDLYSVDYLPGNEKKCGSVKEFFKRYQQ